jgi:WD40 repeat protein
LLATGDAEGTISLWTLPDLHRVACRLDAHTLIYGLAAVEVGGEELLVSGGDRWEVAPGRARNMPSLRAWSVPDLNLRVSESRDEHMTHWLGAIQAGESALVQARGVTSEVWELEPGAETFRLIELVRGGGSPDYLLQVADGEGMLASDDELVPVRVRQSRPATLARGRPVECEPASWAGPVTIRGRGKVLVSASRKLRVWAIRDILDESSAAISESVPSRRAKSAITKLAVGADLLCAGTPAGTAHTWTTASTPSHEEHPLSSSEISALAVTAVAGQTYFVTGTTSGELSCIDAVSDEYRWKVTPGRRISAVKTVHLAGRPAVLAAVNMSTDQRSLDACRLWDLCSGEEIYSFDPVRDQKEMDHWQIFGGGWRLAVQGYRRDKSLNALAAWQTPDGAMAAACCSAAPIPIWLLEQQCQVAQLNVDITGADDIDFGYGHLVAGVGDRLHVWDASRRWSEFSVYARHSVSSVTCGAWEGKPCIASGGNDGSLRIWGFDGSQLTTIDIDEKITSIASLNDDRFAIGTSRGLVVIETN